MHHIVIYILQWYFKHNVDYNMQDLKFIDKLYMSNMRIHLQSIYVPDSKVHGANMGLIWGRQDPGGPHVDPMNLAVWNELACCVVYLALIRLHNMELENYPLNVRFLQTFVAGYIIKCRISVEFSTENVFTQKMVRGIH